LSTQPDAKVGILYQNDDFGRDVLKGFEDGLGAKASMIVAELSYETADPTIDSQIVRCKTAGANVFMSMTTPKFAAQGIKKIAELGWHPVQIVDINATSVGAVMKPAGLEKGVGIISAAFDKDPTDPQWQDTPEYKEWLAWMKKYNPSANIADALAVDGYGRAQTMVAVLRGCGDDLTRENVMKQAASLHNLKLPMVLPGITLSTSADDYAPMKQMQLMKFDGTTWKLFGDVLSGS